MEELLRVGVITSTHGVRGEVKVFPTTDDPQRFKKLKNVILDDGKKTLDLEIQGVKFFKNMVILKFKGLDNMNDVEKFKQADLLVTREHAVKLKPGEYFIVDLIGLNGVTDQGEDIGTLTDVIQTGANDVYVFTDQSGKDLLVPKIPDCIKEIDLEAGKVLVHLMPGLRDL